MDPILIGISIVGLGTAAALYAKQRHNESLLERFGPVIGDPVQDGKAAYIVDQGGFVRGLDMNRTTSDGRLVPHWGLDISAREGTPVRAAVAGQVVRAGPANGYGNSIAIRHDQGGKSTWYAHLHTINVAVGQNVDGGKVIGTVGRTTAGPNGVTPSWGARMGAHLHFEVHPRPEPALGSSVRRDDPVAWLRGQGIRLVGLPR